VRNKTKEMKITRKQAIKIICELMDQDGIDTLSSIQDLYDEETDDYPLMEDVLTAIGITNDEIDEGCGIWYI
jgi:hypothetical protein